MVQSTAQVQAGYSGAPLLDQKGRAVGVVYGKTKNRSFAVGGATVMTFLAARSVALPPDPVGNRFESLAALECETGVPRRPRSL